MITAPPMHAIIFYANYASALCIALSHVFRLLVVSRSCSLMDYCHKVKKSVFYNLLWNYGKFASKIALLCIDLY